MGIGLRCIMVWFHGNRAQAQVAIKKGTELTIRYTHMLQVQTDTPLYTHANISMWTTGSLEEEKAD